MSPEQALAKRVMVDHRTDVYSLGATLYELLTLEPAFKGNDRQELLRQIAFEEPVPPRRVNRAVPAELETIVLKAMEKNPAERYASAKELADDLRRYRDDQPIRARRPAWSTQVRRWSRRHKPLVASVTTLLAAAVLVGGVALWQWQRQRAETEQAVVADIKRARELLEEGRYSEARHQLDRAEERRLQGGPAYLGESLRALRDDVSWVNDLEDVQMRLSKGFDKARADREYTEVFAKRGLDLSILSPEEVARRMQDSPLRARLVLALDSWANAKNSMSATSREQIVTVAGLLDPDSVRQRLRNRSVVKDVAAVERLANEDGLLDQPPATLYQLGIVLHSRGQTAKAEALLRQAQQRHPTDFWITFQLASILDDTDAGQTTRQEEAIGFYRVALALRPESAVIYNNLGITLHKRGKLAEAVAAFRKATELSPGEDAHFANLGQALTQQGKLAEAETACRKAIALKPNSVPGHIFLAELFQRQRKYTAAIALLNKVREVDPKKNWLVHDRLGDLFRDQGERLKAEAAYRKVTELKPEGASAYNKLGDLFRDRGELVKAEAAYRKFTDLEPDNASGYTILGNVLHDQGKLEDAVRAHRKAIELNRNNYPNGYTNLGVALSKQGKRAEAEAAYRTAIALQPNHATAHMNLGLVLKEQRRFPEALAELSEAIRCAPKDHKARFNLGILLRDLGRLPEAEAAYRKAIELKPDYADAHNSLGNLLQRQGRTDEAITCYHRAIAAAPNYAYAHNNLGNVLKDRGQLDEAIACYRKALALDPKNALAHCSLGRTLVLQGRFAEALAGLKRGHELGSRQAGWRYPSAKWVRDTERLVDLADKLPKFLSGEAQPANAVDRLLVAVICAGHKKRYAAAARFYTEAFAAQPDLADDPQAGYRYEAACAAALAGCGQGMDAKSLGDKERARLRCQALDWLQANLTAWRKLLEKDPAWIRPLVQKTMRHWQQDRDFAGVRGPAALSRLPEAERVEWRKLWTDVADTLRRAVGRPPQPRDGDGKP
jgi:tetratricopeptide (TPR) repeat protein